jgi:hypothetical protein
MVFKIAGFNLGSVPSTAPGSSDQGRQSGQGLAARSGRPVVGAAGAHGGNSPPERNTPPRQTPLRAAGTAKERSGPSPGAFANAAESTSPSFRLPGFKLTALPQPRDVDLVFLETMNADDQRSPTPGPSAQAPQGTNPDLTVPEGHQPSDAQLASQQQRLRVLGKQTPYASKHGVAGINLNGGVKVAYSAESAQGSQQPVWCRHLAVEVALHSGKKVDLIKSFSNEEVIRQTFNGRLNDLERTYLELLRVAPPDCKHTVSSQHFGRYLHALANTLLGAHDGQGGPKEVNSLLFTNSHVMTLHIEHKKKAGVDYFAAKVYDPNDTANHKRVEAMTPDGLLAVELSQLLEPGLLGIYARGENKPLWLAAVCLNPLLRPLMSLEAPDRPSADKLLVVLRFGVTNELAAIRESVPPDQLLHMIQAMPRSASETCYLMLQDGHAETAKSFAEIVLDAKMDQTKKVEWLAAKLNGAPGLFMAFQAGHTVTVRAFAETVLNTQKLDKIEIIELLVAANKGVPGLFKAFGKGKAETVNAFVQAVLRAERFSKPEIAKLLAAEHEGCSGLAVAFENGHAQTVKTFAETVLNSRRLDETASMALLKAARNGMPGLMFAFHKGHTETVKAFSASVLVSNLSETAKLELLAAQTHDGALGCHFSFMMGHAETIKAFGEIVLQLNSDDSAKAELLAARGSDGKSGLYWANLLSHTETVAAFIEIVGHSNLSDQHKARLLAAE